MDIVKALLTALLSVAALFAVTKLMGHKQVAQLDFFDYVSGITIGSIGAELATELDEPWKPLLALVIFCCVSLLLSLITHKFPKMRKYVNGTPTILMSGGRLYRKNLKQSKLDLSELLLMLREQGYFDLTELDTVIFEHNGKLSVLPKAASRPLTPADMKITAKAAHIGTELIMDGRIMGENLHRIGRDEKWLADRIALSGYGEFREIFLGIYHIEDDTLTLFPIE